MQNPIISTLIPTEMKLAVLQLSLVPGEAGMSPDKAGLQCGPQQQEYTCMRDRNQQAGKIHQQSNITLYCVANVYLSI